MSSTPLTLVVLAAGMGSRYGGLKQLDTVGPGGATLMDYSVFDARRAGFTDVVFVIRPDMEDVFGPFAAGRYGTQLRVRIALQRLLDPGFGAKIPPGRVKPWGTAHAVLSAREQVTGSFAVVNADDFYGASAFRAVAAFLRDPSHALAVAPAFWAVVGYPLKETLSASGGVNRAVCHAIDGWLTGTEEVFDITATDGTLRGRTPRGPVTLAGETPVSMNMWAFTPPLFDILAAGFARFLERPGAETGEFILPGVVEQAITDGAARVRLLEAGARWFGMTHPADRAAVSRELETLVAAGDYPERLS